MGLEASRNHPLPWRCGNCEWEQPAPPGSDLSAVHVFAWEESPSYLPGGCLPNIGHKGPQTPTGCVIWYPASLILGSVLCCRCQTSTKINEGKLRLLFVCLISFCFIWNFIILTVCAPAQQGDGSLSLRLTTCLQVHFLFRISCVWMCAHVCMQAHVAFPPCFLKSKWHYRHILQCVEFYVSPGDVSSGPRLCAPSAWPTEPSPQHVHLPVSELRRCNQVLLTDGLSSSW